MQDGRRNRSAWKRARGEQSRHSGPGLRARPGEVTGPCEVGKSGKATAQTNRRGGGGELSRSPRPRSPCAVAVAVAVAVAAAVAAATACVTHPSSARAWWAECRPRSGDLGAGPRRVGAREGGGARGLGRARDCGACSEDLLIPED